MNCRYVQSRISAYIDMELTGHEHQLIRSHLGNCLECSREYEQLRRTKHLLRQLPLVAPSTDSAVFLARVRVQKSVSERATVRFGWRPAKWWQMAGGAAAVGVFLWWNSTTTPIGETSFASSQPAPTQTRSVIETSLFKTRPTSPVFVLEPFDQPSFSQSYILPTNYNPFHSIPAYGGFQYGFGVPNR